MIRKTSDRRRWLQISLHGALALLTAGAVDSAVAQAAYPQRPISMVVGFAAGGGVDAFARLLSTELSKRVGQQVVVDNRPGASGMIAGERVARSAPDGYTVLMADYSSLTIAMKASAKPLFDLSGDLRPVAMAATMPLVVAVTPSLPVSSLQDLVSMAKREPDRLSYATPGIASAHQLAMEWLKQSLGFQMQHVPYKGASALMPDVMSGVVPVGVMSAAAAIGPAKAGQLKVLGVTGHLVVPDAPQWRPIGEVVPGFDASPRLFVLAPAATPPEIVGKLAAAVKDALGTAELQQGLRKLGGVVTFAEGGAAETEMKRETTQWAEVVRKAGVTLE